MAGKKGSLHKDWEKQTHIIECVEAYDTFEGNCKKAAKVLIMKPQHLSWIWNRAGLKPKGMGKPPIIKNIELIKLFEQHGNCSKAARELGIDRNKARRCLVKFGYIKT